MSQRIAIQQNLCELRTKMVLYSFTVQNIYRLRLEIHINRLLEMILLMGNVVLFSGTELSDIWFKKFSGKRI